MSPSGQICCTSMRKCCKCGVVCVRACAYALKSLIFLGSYAMPLSMQISLHNFSLPSAPSSQLTFSVRCSTA